MEQSTLNFIYLLAVIGALAFVLWLAKILWALLKAVLPAKDFNANLSLTRISASIEKQSQQC